jgi:hypothetical protein
MRKDLAIFIENLKTHNLRSIKIFERILMVMRLCTIILYDQIGQKKLYGPLAILVLQRKAVIIHSKCVILIYFPLQKW